ncbi:hypothetical protein Nepgr_022690 [Nepenthes gracilis]|uniref:CRM domain-containing protein n=1 Tax=Nepenthes gracilis TaxID=150966 RepID=A0AAD3XX89_NEPGR|nr:hypothetical protein Nepgr_022690 [Nepenthes gracilis]
MQRSPELNSECISDQREPKMASRPVYFSLFRPHNLRNYFFSPSCFFPFARNFSLLRKRRFGSLITGRTRTITSPDAESLRVYTSNGYLQHGFTFMGCHYIHFDKLLKEAKETVAEPPATHSESSTTVEGAGMKAKRKKLKGKRAVVRWLKLFRWKKKKEYQRMTAEEKILYKLNKARKKEERLVEALKKIEPKDSSETTHDPEILTPEEHFYFLKMGLKCKNYVPVGRRGIYGGVILNMHLHWKKHQTLKVIVKTFSPEEVKEIAVELARLSGGIVLDIHEENTVIMYRGKNYSQPPTEIMSPRITLSKKKALDKSRYRDALRAVRRYIPKLHQELNLLQAEAQRSNEGRAPELVETSGNGDSRSTVLPAETSAADDSSGELSTESNSEDLSDIFETESETEAEKEEEGTLYLDAFEKFKSAEDIREEDNFEEQLRQISSQAKRAESSGKDSRGLELDDVDRLFLQAAQLLKKRRRER